MVPTYVALVPFDEQSHVPSDELLHVAAALQTQVVRDLSRIWGISAVVSPFLSLERVPPGYIPLAIVAQKLPLGKRGFHLAPGGLPFGLVEKQSDWPLVASHELMELLCDPYGERTLLGPSLKDEQGPVDYLVEVCDPCEDSSYTINDVLVSDFVTPQYYDVNSKKGRYSCQGEIEKPLQVREGCYLSWQTRLPQRSVWQARSNPKGALVFSELSDVTSRSSPEWIAAPSPRDRSVPAAGSEWQYSGVGESSEDWAENFRRDITELLGWLSEPVKRPGLEEILALLQHVVDNWADFDGQPDKLKTKLSKDLRINTDEPSKIAELDDYKKVINALKEQKKLSGLFGPDLYQPGMALWLCMLIGN